MPKFRKKPVVVEAHMFAGGKIEPGWPKGWLDAPHSFSADGESCFIKTLEGIHEARKGDWIICGIAGEFYPCKPDIFEQTYEPVSELQCDLCGGWYKHMQTILVTKHDETEVYMAICDACAQLRGADEKKTKDLLRNIFVYPMCRRTQRVLKFIGHPNQEKFQWILDCEAKVIGAINELMGVKIG